MTTTMSILTLLVFSTLLSCTFCQCPPDPSMVLDSLILQRYFMLTPPGSMADTMNSCLASGGQPAHIETSFDYMLMQNTMGL